MHVLLPRGEGVEYGKDIGRKRDQDGCPVEHENANPLLNTRVYKEDTEGHEFILLQASATIGRMDWQWPKMICLFNI